MLRERKNWEVMRTKPARAASVNSIGNGRNHDFALLESVRSRFEVEAMLDEGVFDEEVFVAGVFVGVVGGTERAVERGRGGVLGGAGWEEVV